MGVGLGDLAALALLTRWNRRKLALALGEDGAVAFLYGLGNCSPDLGSRMTNS